MDPSAISPDVTLDRLALGIALLWSVFKKLGELTDAQKSTSKSQGERIGALEDKLAKLEARGGGQ